MNDEDARHISAHFASQLPRGIVGEAEETVAKALLCEIQLLADPLPGSIWLCEGEPTANWLAASQDGREHVFSATAKPSGGLGSPLAAVTVVARPLRVEAWIVDLSVEQMLRQPNRLETSWTFWYQGQEFLTVLGIRQATSDSWQEWSFDSAEQFARLLAQRVDWPIDTSFA